MTTVKPKTPRKPPQRLSLQQQLTHDYCMSVLKSTATFQLLEAEDGFYTGRLVHLGREYSTKFFEGAAS